MYRPDIDGLRAIAVSAVVAFHAFPSVAAGGFVGVDVFFVISGFLITSIILRDHEKGNFTYRTFYARRIKRIFPALAIVLGASLVAGWFIFFPREYASLGRDAGAGAGFSANFVLISEAGYFDIDALRKPLLHLWSLGIEEQFYLLWPVLLVMAMRRGLNLLALVGILAAASFGLSVWKIGNDPVGTFYLPQTRAWELMIGCALAYVLHRVPPQRDGDQTLHDIGALVGATLIVVSVLFLHQDTTYPGWWALLPVLAAVLFIVCNRAFLNRRILSSTPLVAIGLISYPLYLWHWPLITFVRAVTAPSLTIMVVAVAASVALAWLTFVLVERPIRFGRPDLLKVAVPVAAMAVVGCVGLWTLEAEGFPMRLARAGVIVDPAGIYGPEWRLGHCFLDPTDQASAFDRVCAGDGRRPLVLLWGSSAAAALYPGLEDLQGRYHFDLSQYTASGCDPVFGITKPDYPHCEAINAFVLDQIAKLKPEIVLLHAAWDTAIVRLLDASVAGIRARAPSRIVLIGGEPMWLKPNGLPEIYSTYAASHPSAPTLPERARLGLTDAEKIYEDATRAKAKELNIEYISLRKILCNDEGCLTRIDTGLADGLTTFDQFHLSVGASRFVAEGIAKSLF